MRSLSVRSKLLAMMLLAGILCLAAGGLVADHFGSLSLQRATFNQLTGLREAKRAQVEAYLGGQRRAFRLLSQTPVAAEALVAFSGAYGHLNQQKPEPAPAELVKFYQDSFLPGLAKHSQGNPALEFYLPADNASRTLQADYIAGNPYSVAEKLKYNNAPDGSPYDILHARFHPYFSDAAVEDHFDDLMLIDAQTGTVVYSVSKQIDFATNLKTGPLSRSGLARAYEAALDLRDSGAVAIEDFSPYPPVYLAPAAFLSAPIVQNGAIVGVIVAQLSTADLDMVMSDDRRWKETGLGDTGSAYLVGPDQRMRSNDRFIVEDKPGYLKAIADAGLDRELIARIDAFDTMILFQPIDTVASRSALHGGMGTAIIADYRGRRVLSSWAPLRFTGLRWAVIAEMDETEAFAPQRRFRGALLLVAAAAAIILTLASLVWAHAFIRPIREILTAVKTLGSGDDSARIPVQGNDEFSELAQAFNAMAGEIALRNRAIHAKTAEYEALLRNVYPEMIAERVKLGQTSIAEMVRNISVLVLNIGGVTALFQSTTHDTVRIMNEIIDAFDEAAGRIGVEKLKTVGESYFAVSGLTTPRLDHAARAVGFAEEACRILDRLRRNWNLPLDLRAGIASGDAEAGLIGRQRTVYDLWGPIMVFANRIVFEADANSVRITEATLNLLGDIRGFQVRPTIAIAAIGSVVTYERPALAVIEA